MRIVYAVTTCSDRTYRALFSNTAEKPAFQSQKYHRLLIEGLARHVPVEVLACPPLNQRVMESPCVKLPPEQEGGAHYRYIAAYRNPIRKLLHTAVASFAGVFRMAGRDSVVVVDVLNRVQSFFALLAARARGCRCVGIVTDLPDMLGGGKLYLAMANYVIRHCTDYVLLTEAMNAYIGNESKPYVVLEGHADIAMAERKPDRGAKQTPMVCLYAGGVSRQYGLEELVEGFRQADLPNAALHIYGPGDYVEDLKKIAAGDHRIYYGGMLLNHEVVERELTATLLVNPRPTHEEYVKYSFPSKTMEYMASGTPVLTTRLPGMPREYVPYVYFIEQETAQGVAEALRQVFSHSQEELFQKGLAAREFVLGQRNNVVQAGKIVEMLKKTEVRR